MSCIDILMEMFYPRFQPPKETGHRVHRSAFAGLPRFIEPKKPHGRPKRDENALCPSEERAYNILWRKGKAMTSNELAPLMKMTTNHCGILLTSLYKKGKLSRVKYSKPGTRFYRYTVKEES